MVKLQKNVISSATFIRLLLTLISVSSFFKRNPWKLKHSQDSKNFVIKIYVDVWYTGCITVFLVFDVIMIQEIGSAVTSLCWPNLLLMAVADRGTTLSYYYLDTSLGRQPGPDCWRWWGQRTGAMCRPSLITPRYPLPDLWTMFDKAWTLHVNI